MATNFPASLDTLTNPTSSDSLSSPSHSAQHANANDAIEALQAKVGADSSAVTTSLDYKVAQLEAASTGKILQVVRNTNSSNFTTSSTTAVDVTGVNVTITPTSASSQILLLVTARAWVDNSVNNDVRGFLEITDSSNNVISGAEQSTFGTNNLTGTGTKTAHAVSPLAIAWATPATTSAVTYKLRAYVWTTSGVLQFNNATQTAQMFAIEVSA